MPLGWGRAVGSHVGSHFGSLGRPPGTKKGILQLYNNEHGLSSSTQLQNQLIHNSSEQTSNDYETQNSSEGYGKEGRSQENSQAININNALEETNYLRSLQIGAVLALAYNLVSGHLRLRALQAQKPLLTSNAKKTQLLVPTEKKVPKSSRLDQNGKMQCGLLFNFNIRWNYNKTKSFQYKDISIHF